MSRGFQSTPPLAMAAVMRATWSGVTSSAPCPMDMFSVSPECQGRPRSRRPSGDGISPGFSPGRSTPVALPSPKARE